MLLWTNDMTILHGESELLMLNCLQDQSINYFCRVSRGILEDLRITRVLRENGDKFELLRPKMNCFTSRVRFVEIYSLTDP